MENSPLGRLRVEFKSEERVGAERCEEKWNEDER